MAILTNSGKNKEFDLEFKRSWQPFYVPDGPSNLVLAPSGVVIQGSIILCCHWLTNPISDTAETDRENDPPNNE